MTGEDSMYIWKVRLFLPGGCINALSRVEPKAHKSATGDLQGLECDFITDTEFGDDIGFLRWNTVMAASWRKEKQGDWEKRYTARKKKETNQPEEGAC